jgi:hypothetical protein
MNQVARLSLVDRADAQLSIVAQCRLLKVARSSLYWRPTAVSENDLRLMRRIEELYLATPFYGARRMVAVLRREGWTINRKRAVLVFGVGVEVTVVPKSRSVWTASAKYTEEWIVAQGSSASTALANWVEAARFSRTSDIEGTSDSRHKGNTPSS